jgi:hypothetical protein
MTNNHNYTTPEQGTENWDVPINENFDQLDSDVEIRDEETNRSQYEPKQGAKFLATDTKKVFLGDGANWNYLTTLGGIEGRIFVQSEEPNGREGDVWIDTS